MIRLNKRDNKVIQDRAFTLLRIPGQSKQSEIEAYKIHAKLMRMQPQIRGLYKRHEEGFRKRFRNPKKKTDWKQPLFEFIAAKLKLPMCTVRELKQMQPCYGEASDD